jgi:group I intron endonuclease
MMIFNFKDVLTDKNKIPPKCGIYKIRNIINDHIYIGQSSNLKNRFLDHYRMMNNKRKNRFILYKATDKHNLKNFVFEIIEFCEYDKLSEREVFYILKLNPHYNIIKSPQIKRGYNNVNEDKIIKIFELKNDGFNSVEISKTLKLSKKIIRDILNKRTYIHIIEKHDLKIYHVKNNVNEVISLLKRGFSYKDIRLFFPNYNNKKIKKIKEENSIQNKLFQIEKEEYEIHSENIKKNNTECFLKNYCLENKLPLSKFIKFIKNRKLELLSKDIIFKIYELAKNNTKRKEISRILNIPFKEVIDVLREDGRSKYDEFKKKHNLYIERKRNFRKNINSENEKKVLMVFDLYKKNINLIDISNKLNISYNSIYKIIFNKNRYIKIKEKHNLHPITDKYVNI